MKTLEIPSTGVSPKVILDKDNSIFEFYGKSIMLNTAEFYTPILDWIDNYAHHPNNEMTLVFNLKYYNLTSVKYIMFMVYKLREIQNSGCFVSVVWYYSIYDDYMKEFGEDLQDLYKVPFKFSAYDVFERLAG